MEFTQEAIKERIMDGLRSRASWAEVLFFSTNSRLIDTISENLSQAISYDEFLTRNTRWDLATEKSALVSQAKFRGYEPHRKIGAKGDIRFSTSETFDGSYSKNIPIPKYTVVSDGGDVQFVTTQLENLLPGDEYLDIPVVQGEPKSFTYIADGDKYEEITIDNDSIENDEYELYVNGELWSQIDNLNSASKDDKVYELENKLNYDGIMIRFGNGIFGRKLNSGDTVLFKYVQTLGIEGNVLGTNVIDTVESTIYDEDGTQVDFYCKNTGNLDGGQDEEDLESIRVNGVDTFQAGDKAVVQKDYEVKLRQSDYILKATVWGAYEYNLDNNLDLWEWVPTEENVVKVSAFTPAGEQLTESQQEEVIEFIKQDKPPTDIVRFYDVNFIYLAFHIQLFVRDPSYVLSDVKARVIDAVEEEYGLENIDFRQPLYDTGWKGFINDIDGVTYHASYIEIIKYEDFGEAYLGDVDLDLTPIEIESIRIYIRDNSLSEPEWEFVAQDDGDGGFIEESGYDLTGSSINYETGEGVIDVVDGLDGDYEDYEIKIYYQVDTINIHLDGRNQIFKIEEIEDVTAEYLLE